MNNTVTIYNFCGEEFYSGPSCPELDEQLIGQDFIALENSGSEAGRFWVGLANGFMSFATWPTLQAALDYVNRER